MGIVEKQKISYVTQEERAAIIESKKGTNLVLLGNYCITGEQFLVFGENPYYKDEVFIKERFFNSQVLPLRKKLLENSDIFMLVDNYNALSEAEQQEWVTYRQILRHLPQTLHDITEPVIVDWPVMPETERPE